MNIATEVDGEASQGELADRRRSTLVAWDRILCLDKSWSHLVPKQHAENLVFQNSFAFM